MNTVCCIIGGVAADYSLPRNRFIIAADKGYELLKRKGIMPDLAVGDFDSAESIPSDLPILRHPVEKDDTDTLLAIKEGFARGYRIFVLYGCLGGDRFEHSLANLQALAYIAAQGGMGFLVDTNTVITAIRNSKLMFDAHEKGEISVFCMGADAEGVNIKGLHYSLTNATLTADMPLGISNSFEGKAAFVSVKTGTLHILWHKSTDAFLYDLTGELPEICN